MTDEEIRERLMEVDQDDDIEVTSWEADFLQNILGEWEGHLTPRQRESAEKILDKYGKL